MESVTSLDSSGAHELEDWIRTWQKSNLNTCITGTRGPIRDILHSWGIIQLIGQHLVFNDDATAVDFFDQKIDSSSVEEMSAYALQSSKKK